jgi:hypothetical protein
MKFYVLSADVSGWAYRFMDAPGVMTAREVWAAASPTVDTVTSCNLYGTTQAGVLVP